MLILPPSVGCLTIEIFVKSISNVAPVLVTFPGLLLRGSQHRGLVTCWECHLPLVLSPVLSSPQPLPGSSVLSLAVFCHPAVEQPRGLSTPSGDSPVSSP